MWSERDECALRADFTVIDSTFYRTRHLERNAELGISLHIFEQNFLTAAVIKFRGPTVGVASDALSGFQRAVIFQKIRDAGRPEGVRRIVSWEFGLFEPSFKHVRGVSAHESPAR
jgi:hypothetical protein